MDSIVLRGLQRARLALANAKPNSELNSITTSGDVVTHYAACNVVARPLCTHGHTHVQIWRDLVQRG